MYKGNYVVIISETPRDFNLRHQRDQREIKKKFLAELPAGRQVFADTINAKHERLTNSPLKKYI